MKSWTQKVKHMLKFDSQPTQLSADDQKCSYNQIQAQKSVAKKSIFQSLFFRSEKQQNSQQKQAYQQSGTKTYDQAVQLNSQSEFSHRDDDEDSLGFTQNQWDEQTINFQLEDRMLDCLEDQKHVKQYRESLSSNLSSKIKLNRNTRISAQLLETQVREHSALGSQIQRQTQKQEAQFTNVKQKTQLKQSMKKKQRKNRFQKYLNHKQSNEQPQPQIRVENYQQKITQQQDIFDTIKIKYSINQKQPSIRQLAQISKDLNCNDFIDRVFNIPSSQAISSQKSLPKKPFSKNQKMESQKSKHLNTSKVQIRQNQGIKSNEMAKKDSNSSAMSFQVQQGTAQFRFQQINGMCSEIQSASGLYNQSGKEKNNSDATCQDIQSQQHQNKLKKVVNFEESHKNSALFTKISLKDHVAKQNFHVLTPPRNLNLEQHSKSSSAKIQIVISPRNVNSLGSRGSSKQNNQRSTDKSSALKPALIYSPASINKKPENIPVIRFNYQQSETNQIRTNVISSPKNPQTQGPSNKKLNINFSYSPNNQNKDKKPVTPQNKKFTQRKITFTSVKQSEPLKNQSGSEYNQEERFYFKQPQPQDIVSIFLQRLSRLNSTYPNLQYRQIDINRIKSDVQKILITAKSAIDVLELLYKKLCIHQSSLQKPINKIIFSLKLLRGHEKMKSKIQNEILQFFLNSDWENYKIEEIDFIKPKKKFIKRKLIPGNFENALKNFSQIVAHYQNSSQFDLSTLPGKQRYFRIRTKISQIQKYLKLMSEDLYTFWLLQCNYPYVYSEYIAFLKSQSMNAFSLTKTDEILAKLIQGQLYNDPVSLSIIGRKIHQKIQESYT